MLWDLSTLLYVWKIQKSESNTNIKNGFTFFICKFNIQVLIFKIVRNQIANLIPTIKIWETLSKFIVKISKGLFKGHNFVFKISLIKKIFEN
jgi:hypothetical protein